MKAVKDNREYTISDSERDYYKKRGFDIKDDSGNIVEYGNGKTVPYEEYMRLKREYEALKGGNQKESALNELSELQDMSLDELKAYAEAHEINIGNATTKEGILKKIKEAE